MPSGLPQEASGKNGAIAQLGERFNGIEEVVGSIPSGSTNNINYLVLQFWPARLAASDHAATAAHKLPTPPLTADLRAKDAATAWSGELAA